MNTAELNSLFRLLDDPDENIYENIYSRFLTYDIDVLPEILSKKNNLKGNLSSQRLEHIVFSMKTKFLKEKLVEWKKSDQRLLPALLILNKAEYPDVDETKIIKELNDIKINIWVQMSYDLPAYDIINIFNRQLFKISKYSGDTETFDRLENSFIWSVMNRKKGNQVLLSCIYLIIAEMMDIPIRGINFPHYFLVGYMKKTNINNNRPLFYISPFDAGSILEEKDLNSLLKKMNISPQENYFTQCSNIEIVKRIINNIRFYYNLQKNEFGINMGEELIKVL